MDKIGGDASAESRLIFLMKIVPLLYLALVITGRLWAGEIPAPTAYEPAQFFRSQILPILENRCFECHSRQHEVEGALALDFRSDWETGGESGPAVKPGDLKNSLIIRAVRRHDPDTAMPPRKKLSPIEVALLETWVLLGAPDPRMNPAKPQP